MSYRSVLAIIFIFMIVLISCNSQDLVGEEIEFKDLSTEVGAGEYKIAEAMYDLDGQLVEIKGYMSTLTPLRREFFFLTENPGVACPYCDGEEINYFTLIQVYFPQGEGFSFSRDKQRIVGRFEVGKKQDQFGVKSKFRLQAELIEKVD